MAAELFSPPSKALDANANPYAGATWTFYLTGTSTPQAVFADADLDTSLGAVVTADSSGKFANIYFDATKAYRAVCKDSAGAVTLHDIDPVNPAALIDNGFAQASDYGAVGDGVALDRAALQLALNTGRPVALLAGHTYLIDSGLDHVTGSGFVCFDGIATIKAKTGVGGFNIKTEVGTRTGLDRNMLVCNATDGIVLRNIHFTTDQNTEVVLHGVRMYGGMGTVGYDFSGLHFSRFYSGRMVALGGTGGGRNRSIHIASATNSGASQGNTYWTGSIQTTVVEIDNDKPGTTPSAAGIIRIDYIGDILFSGQAATDYGQETDGVNIPTQGANSTFGWDISIGIVERIGEPVDIQGWNNRVRIGVARFIHNDVIKLIHGAQYNDIEVDTVQASGRSVVGIFGSSTAPAERDTSGNNIRIGSVKAPGTYGLGLSGTTSIVLIGNSTSTYKPTNNVVRVADAVGDGVNLDYIVRDGSGSAANNNLVIIDQASGWAVASTSAPPSNVRVRCMSPCLTTMALSGNQTGIVNAADTKLAFAQVVTDLEGLAVSGSNKIMVKWPGAYRLTAQIRLASQQVNTADQVILSLRQNVSLLANAAFRIQFSAADETMSISADFYVNEDLPGTAGADLTAWILQTRSSGTTALAVSDVDHMTFLTLARIG